MTAKEQALALISRLPDQCSEQDILGALGGLRVQKTRVRALEIEHTEIRLGASSRSGRNDAAQAYENWQNMVSI